MSHTPMIERLVSAKQVSIRLDKMIQENMDSIYPGEFVAILGRTGGKSTLLKILLGSCTHGGKSSAGGSRDGTNSSLPPPVSTLDSMNTLRLDIVGFASRHRWHRPSQQKREKKLNEVLEEVTPCFSKLPSRGFGGERQRLLLAQSISLTPAPSPDEPLASLDIGHAQKSYPSCSSADEEHHVLLVPTRESPPSPHRPRPLPGERQSALAPET